MKFSKYEEKQMQLNKERLEQAKRDYLEVSISCILVHSNEPDMKKDYLAWEKWKTHECRRVDNNLKKSLKALSIAVVREKAFREVCYEAKHNESLPNEEK